MGESSISLSFPPHTHTHTGVKIQHSNGSDRFTVRVELLHVSDLCLLVSWNDSCLWVPPDRCLGFFFFFFFLPSVCLLLAGKCLFMNVHTDIHSELPYLHLWKDEGAVNHRFLKWTERLVNRELRVQLLQRVKKASGLNTREKRLNHKLSGWIQFTLLTSSYY